MQFGTYWEYLIIRLSSGIEKIYITVPMYINRNENMMKFFVFTKFS